MQKLKAHESIKMLPIEGIKRATKGANFHTESK